MASESNRDMRDGIALIGMAGRWPHARNVAEYWRNIRDGVDCISRFSAAELEVQHAAELAAQPSYVMARSVIDDPEWFDAAFFGVLPKEAECIDPQQRIFLEICWEALEDAGYDPHNYSGMIGLFAGSSSNSYFLRNMCHDRRFVERYTGEYPLGNFSEMLGSLPDCLGTRVSYKLNLKGPSCTIQTACSTSLVAVCQACLSLQSFQCDMALAGGVSVTFPQRRGYFHQDGAMGSGDGYCRAFDANATGTVFGSGAGVVLLKRWDDALADGDHIYAVVRGFAVNNDGANKVGYTAPGVDGQEHVIAMAQALADVDPATIGYMEAHGTGTTLGDPIEFSALTRAFRRQTRATGFCALGTVKPNVGHLEVAAGVSGLINAVHALAHAELPPLLHFEEPNSHIDLDSSPFYFNTALKPWNKPAWPRRAGVSSFGVGGTNAHVVLEESPVANRSETTGHAHLLVISARSPGALDDATRNLAQHLRSQSQLALEDVAFTLQAGRHAFEHRRILACRDVSDALTTLESQNPNRVVTRACDGRRPSVVFMFPGQGSQYARMGSHLYQNDIAFRNDVDGCCETLKSLRNCDLQPILNFLDSAENGSRSVVTDTQLVQPAVFVIEYAMARHWKRWGIEPDAMIGHSLGEFVAACLAGVFSLEDALAIVAERGRLMQQPSGGAMLSVRLAEDDVRRRMPIELSIAAVNAPLQTVVSGPGPAIERFRQELERQGVVSRELTTHHAFHSRIMDPIIQPFRTFLNQFHFNAPARPYISGVSGDWITSAEATSPDYWARHLREPVQFSRGIQSLMRESNRVYLEVGPGTVLSRLVSQHRQESTPVVAIPSLPEPTEQVSESVGRCHAAGLLWLHGVTPDWAKMHLGKGRRCSLPTYPFQRSRYWIAPGTDDMSTDGSGINTALTTVQRIESAEPESKPLAAANLPKRIDRIRETVVELLQELSGLRLSGDEASATFTELGFDSLFLTQVAQAIKGKFGLKITFRQLISELDSVSRLATYLDAELATAMPPEGSEAPQRDVRSSDRAPDPSALIDVANPGDFGPQGRFKPNQPGLGWRMTERQTRFLQELIDRYTRRTAGSKASTQKNRPMLADPRACAGFRTQWKEMVYPLVTERSFGSRIWDVDGNEYIDLVNGYGPILLGHSPSIVTEAVSAQLEKGFATGPQTPLAGSVAQLICELTGNERVTFCNTGSEAVMAAIRVARTITGRSRVVLFSGAYHGTFDEVLVKGAHGGASPTALPIAPGIPRENVRNMTVLEYGTERSLEYIRTHAADLAAVLVEPVQSRAPALQPVEFLREIRTITENSGTALIFDEVVTGFRIHPGGAQSHFNIRADLVTYGKVVGGGLPIGILSGRAAFMDALDGGMWQYGDDSFPEVGVTFFAGTFVRHPLALSAANAVLTYLKEQGPQLQERLSDEAASLARTLNGCFAEFGVPTHIEHFGSIMHFGFPADQPFGSLLYYLLREKGVYVLEGYPCFLTTAHSTSDLDWVASIFREAVGELRSSGFFVDSQEPSGGDVPAPTAVCPAPATAPASLPAEVPLTESQLEIWLAAGISDEANCAFNESFTAQLRGRLDVDGLRDAIQRLVARHDALRSTFDPRGDRVLVLGELHLEIPFVDLSARPEEARSAALDRLIEEDAAIPFDLVHGPLARATLVRLNGDHHALVFTSHHIVCDGWSTNVLLDELGQLYAAHCEGKPGTLPVAKQFREFALEQFEWHQCSESREIEAWWVAQYQTPVSPLEMPTDRARPAVKSYSGATARTTIDTAQYQRIKRFGAEQGCTLFITLLTAFKILLHRLTSQGDIVVGIPAAGQSLLDGETLVGHCVNFLPLRSSVDGSSDVRTTLHRVRDTVLDAYENQLYTYGSLVRKLGLPRDPSRLPLVEMQFNLERLGADLRFPGLAVDVDPNPKRFVNFDLFLNIVESNQGLVIDCDFNTDLFDRDTIRRWLHHYQTLLESMVDHRGQPVAKLALLDEAELHQLIHEWNQTKASYPKTKCVHELISEQALARPDDIAVEFERRTLTYSELDSTANRLARFLVKRGVTPGSRVGVYLNRSAEMLIALLGAWRAGAAYVPLDPGYPRQRIKAILDDAIPIVVLTDKETAAGLEELRTDRVVLDATWCENLAESPAPLEATGAADSLAYIIYTSGSTGTPKGVEIRHSSIVNLLSSMANQLGVAAQDRWLAVTTLSFDMSVPELFVPLAAGGTVIIASQDECNDGASLLRRISESSVTIMQATPSTWRLLLAAHWTDRLPLRAICGGEAFPRDLADAMLARCDSVWNGYGPTEITVYSAISRVDSTSTTVPVGRPIANTRHYVLDPYQQPVPIGVRGELYVGGDGVAEGYWKQPKLTSERFVTSPFMTNGSTRLYRTGDLVRYRGDGMLEFLGRMDTQLKIRGFRIEAAEVESVMAQHPGVGECVVAVQEVAPGDRRLVAYFSPRHPEAAPGEIKAFIADKLPDYMVPSLFVMLEALPRTPNGKVNRRALPLPDVDQSVVARAFVSPRTPTEVRLSAICAEVLKLQRVGVTDSLFDLGADSLHMFQIVARAADAQMQITLKQILTHRTIEAICAHMTMSDPTAPGANGPQLVRVARNKHHLDRADASSSDQGG